MGPLKNEKICDEKFKIWLSGVFCLTASLMMFCASQSQGAVGETFLEDEDSIFKFTVLTEEGSTGTVEVGRSVGAGYNISGNITIPSSATHNGITYRVTAIAADGFRSRNKLTSVTIPDSVTDIGRAAFNYCALESIVIPASVNTLGRGAFDDCKNLTSVYFEGNVPDTGYNTIYWGTPETLLTYYPTGNATWEAEIKDGMWKNRKVANWTPAPQPGNEISFTSPDPETGVLTLTFTGTLEESDDMVNWTPVPNAKGSYDVDTKAGQRKFYRFVK